MNTQNTPVHIRLWNRDFWRLAMADLLLSVSATMLVPTLPLWLMSAQNFSPRDVGVAMGAFGVGLYVLGGLCSWLVQHYRRNVVCMWAIAAYALSLVLLLYLNGLRTEFPARWLVLVQRLSMGAAFGLAQMVLSSTLIIDTCESAHRTEANFSASWFSRFALSLGPLAGLVVYGFGGFDRVLLGAIGCAVAAVMLIKMVDFPFRSPEEHVHVASLDRFILPHGFVLFVNLVLFSAVLGLMLSLPLSALFYVLLMGGFLLALLAQRFVFREAELKSEVVSGLILMLFALLVLLAYPQSPVAPLLAGLSAGLVGSRFLLFFIKLSRHCQRGTSQSMYFLGWESGLALGLALGYTLFFTRPSALFYTALTLTATALLMYHCYTHRWFVHHKNR